MKYVIAMLMTAIVLVGCVGGGGSTPAPSAGAVDITCTDLVNDGGTSRCSASATGVALATGTVTIIDVGVISRAQLMEASITVQNTTASAWQGYWGMTFDAGCGGAPTWDIAPIQPTPVIAAGAEWSVTVGGSCGDMPLGQRIMAATLYDTDPATALRVVQVVAELVE